MVKSIFSFDDKSAKKLKNKKNVLGGKGANLGEMGRLGLPVPPGFTITTDVCDLFYKNKKKLPKNVIKNIETELKFVEKKTKKKFGDLKNPLLVSVRSGARISMPGMMETVLNIGLTSKTIPGLIEKTGNSRFVYDSYRRLIMMYADVVMEKAEQKNDINIREKLGFNQFTIGRDHAGAQNVYAPLAAYKLVKKNNRKFKINIFYHKGSYFCNKCQKVVILGECGHKSLVEISGSEFRNSLIEKKQFKFARVKLQNYIKNINSEE